MIRFDIPLKNGDTQKQLFYLALMQEKDQKNLPAPYTKLKFVAYRFIEP